MIRVKQNLFTTFGFKYDGSLVVQLLIFFFASFHLVTNKYTINFHHCFIFAPNEMMEFLLLFAHVNPDAIFNYFDKQECFECKLIVAEFERKLKTELNWSKSFSFVFNIDKISLNRIKIANHWMLTEFPYSNNMYQI